MDKYTLTGMSCAACVARVEKAVKGVCGVTECSVNLLTNSMNVEGTASQGDIISAVAKAGYGAIPKESREKSASSFEGELKDTETPKLRKRLIYSLIFLIVLMYVSMGHNMWSFPLPSFFEGNYLAIGILQAILSGIVLVINQKFFINGFKSAIKLSPNMDTLVALGSGVSYAYSTVCLFIMTGVSSSYGHELLHGLYFESSAMILVLITVGKMLEAYSKGKTTSALKELMSLQPKVAIIIADGKEKEVDASSLQRDDVFIVKAGLGIPVDGVIIEGDGTANEASLTGESVPLDKREGDKVYAGTTLATGYIKCRVTARSNETVLSQIIDTVKDSASSKAPIARVADKVSGVFVPAVLLIALITTAIWLIVGSEIGYALARGISVLVISCPCALGLATPVAIMVGNGVGARNGILFKNATALENLGRAEIVALDKTGTITRGEPTVTDVIPFGIDENSLLRYAYSLEKMSSHPLATAINVKCENDGIEAVSTSDFKVLFGSGVECVADGKALIGGNIKLVSEGVYINNEERSIYDSLCREGKTPMLFALDGRLIGIIAVRDQIKKDSCEAITELKKEGIQVVMLTGDNSVSAKAIGEIVKVDEIISDVMPNDKERVIKELKEKGRVVMVGDGINDSPALVTADTGIAIGQGTQIAVDSAQVVLMNDSLMDVCHAIRISKCTLRNIHQNLFWAFIYNAIGIPLAAGAFIALLGWELNPMFGALAMSLSSFCVVTNALRLNFINFKKEKNKMFGKKKTGVILNVEGMMCPHCEARVKKAVEEIEGVSEAVPSHKKKTVTVFGECDIERVKAVITEQGYKVK